LSSTKKNFLYQILYQVLISILPFITSPYISRILGAENLGTYSYVYSIITFFILFANLGINNYGNRLIAKSRENNIKLSKEFTSLFILHLLLSILTSIIYMVFVIIFVTEDKTIYIIQSLFLIANMIDISWLFFGLEKFKLTVTRNSIIKIMTVILVFIVVKSSNDLWKYTAIMSLGTLFSQITLWGFVKKYTKFTKVKLKDLISHIKPMLMLFVAALAIVVFSYTDKIMLGRMSEMAQLGYYENAYKLIEFPVGFITALGTVMLPKISNLLSKKDDNKAKEYIGLSMKCSMFAASIIFWGILSIAKEFSYLFWGKEFLMSGIIIQYLSICIILMSWNGVIRTQYLIPNEKDKKYLIAVLISAVVNVIINYILIPKYGGIGAAIGTVCSYFTIFIIQNVFVIKTLPLKEYISKSIGYFFIGAIMFHIINLINMNTEYSVISLITKILIGGCVYLLLLIIYTFIVKDEFILNNLKKIKIRKVKNNE